MKTFRYHIVAVFFILFAMNSYAKEPSRRELLEQACELAEAERYFEAIDNISKIEDATVVEDNILANAQVLKFNIGKKIYNDQYQRNAVEMLKALVTYNPEDLSQFRESLLEMIIRYERAQASFEERMCGIWVSPTMNTKGQNDTAPRYRLFVYKEGDKYKAMLNFSGRIVLTTEDMKINPFLNTLEIYGGEGKFNKGSSELMTNALVGAIGQTAQDAHEMVALKNKSDLISMENYGGQVAVSLASGLLQSLLAEASVSKTKAFSTVISCQEIAPGIIDVNAEEVDREIRSDNANNFTVKRGHVRLYKVPLDIETQSQYLPAVQKYKVKYMFNEPFSWSVKLKVVYSDDNGSFGISDWMKESELKRTFLRSNVREKDLGNAAKDVNLSTNRLVEQFYKDKYLSLLDDIFQRDFHGESHAPAQIPYNGDVTEENMAAVNRLMRDAVYEMGDYENALPYFEEDYSAGRLTSGSEYFQFATCCNKLGDPKDIEIALEGIRKFPDFSLLYSFVLKTFSRESRFDGLYRTLVNAWIKVESTSSQAHYFFGLWYENAGNRLAAIEEYSKSTELDPQFYFSYIKAGELLFENAKDAFSRHDEIGTIIQTLHDSASNFEHAIFYTKKDMTRYVKEYLCTIYTFLLYNDPSKASEYSFQLRKHSSFYLLPKS